MSNLDSPTITSHHDEACKKLETIRTNLANQYQTVAAHHGYMMEQMIVTLAGIRDEIAALRKVCESANANHELPGIKNA